MRIRRARRPATPARRFDAHHAAWDADQRALFEAMLEEQDVDIMAWAHGTADVPKRFDGPMIEALKQLDYIRILK